MDDEVGQGWTIHAETRALLRLERARSAFDAGDLGSAIVEAEELLDEFPDHPEALFLLAEAMLEAGDPEGAAQAYEQHLAASETPRPEAFVGLAVARFDLCDIAGAAEIAREAVRVIPDAAEAHYYLGLALERQPGRRAEALTAFAAARQLDPAAYPFPVHLTEREWQGAVRQALGSLSPDLRDFWSGVPIRLEDLPDLDALRAEDPPISPTISGLYEGVPPEGDPGEARPAALRLFRANLARLGSLEAIVAQIGRTLQDEAADWFGTLDDDLDAEE